MDSQLQTLKRIHQLTGRKWMMLLLFVAITTFFSYVVWTNYVGFVKVYKRYKRATIVNNSTLHAANDPYSAPNDDETYDDDDDELPKLQADNSTIKTNIDKMKTMYKPYNDLLHKTALSKDKKCGPKKYGKEAKEDDLISDKVDEKIISQEYDNYRHIN